MRLLQKKVPAYSFVNFRLSVSFLLILCVLGGQSTAQDFKTVHDGVEYAEVTRKIGDDQVKINLLRLDLKKVRLDVHHAMDAAIGTEKTSSIATRKGAVAAINAGFFRLDTSIWAGEASNWLVIDSETYSEAPVERIALFIINDSKKLGVDPTGVHIKKLSARLKVESRKKTLEVAGINRQLGENEIAIFNPAFHNTTLTDRNTVEVIVRNSRIVEVSTSGSANIPRDGYVISASGKGKQALMEFAVIGKKCVLLHTFREDMSAVNRGRDPIYDTSTLWAIADDIVAGVPQLIKNGEIDITWEQEQSSKSFVETRHPRTAVAKLKDGKFLMITVDGRQPGVSVGMNLDELAAYLLELGAVDAMNLDGGGSTTMFLDGKVVNKPSGESERKVSDAILVTLRMKSRLKK